MKRADRLRISRILSRVCASGLVAAFVAMAACSNGGEGDRCERNNGNADCKDGLICMAGSQAASGWQNGGDWCCPQDRTQATAPPCVLGTGTVPGADDAAPEANTPDAGDAN
ncbi:MAG: hypothetical protein FWD69_06290 [Polyangiaceae bacterium]|nr:hypothetical protein [Polyangiaceae bacterium]